MTPLLVNHKDLSQLKDGPSLSRGCPQCANGILLVRRDLGTLQLLAEDNCLLCGQPVVYADIAEMQANDWAQAVTHKE